MTWEMIQVSRRARTRSFLRSGNSSSVIDDSCDMPGRSGCLAVARSDNMDLDIAEGLLQIELIDL